MNCFRCGMQVTPGVFKCPHCGFEMTNPVESPSPAAQTPSAPIPPTAAPHQAPPSYKVPIWGQTWFIILTAVLCMPVSLICIWKSAPWKQTTKWLVTIVFVVLFIGLAAASKNDKGSSASSPVTASTSASAPPSPAQPVVAAIPVSANTLGNMYMNNEVAANAKYGNKQIIVSGTILTIKTAADGTPYVEFQPDNGLAIYCAFAPSDSGQLVNLRSNQQVRIEGTCSGTFEPNANLSAILGVSVQNCSVK